MQRTVLCLGALCLITVSGHADLFTGAAGHTFQIELTPNHGHSLRQEARRDVPATLRVNGQIYPSVGLHLKGTRGSFQTLDGKPSFTVDFTQFGSTQTLAGATKLHLNNSAEDRSFLREKIASEVFAAAGLPAPRISHVLVKLNGRRLGLYVLKEGLDETFFQRHLGSAGGTLYEPLNGRDVDAPMQRHTGPADDDEQLNRKRVALAATQPELEDRWGSLLKVLNVEQFLDFMAIEVMIGHWDGYSLAGNNFRIYHDPKTDQFVFLPWGMDQALTKPDFQWRPDMTGLLARAVLEVPAGREQYAVRFRKLFSNLFQPMQLTNRVHRLLAQLRPLLSSFEFEEVAREADELCGQIAARSASLERQLNTPQLEVTPFAGNLAKLDRWTPFDPPGGGRMMEIREPAGQAVLTIAAGPRTSASWRTEVRLPRGCYEFRGQVKAASISPLPFGRHQGAALRVAGQAPRAAGRTGSDVWQSLALEFEVSGPEEQIVLVCELRASGGEAAFDKESLVLLRRSCEPEPLLSRLP